MAIQRPDPLRSLVELRERMNRMFEETLSRSFEAADGENAEATAWKPNVDLYEHPDRYVLRIDLPGVPAAEVQIQVERDTLVLSGERRVEPGLAREAFLRVERPHGRFSRQIALPATVDQSKIRASHRNGVLEVELPKKREDAPGKIQVQVN